MKLKQLAMAIALIVTFICTDSLADYTFSQDRRKFEFTDSDGDFRQDTPPTPFISWDHTWGVHSTVAASQISTVLDPFGTDDPSDDYPYWRTETALFDMTLILPTHTELNVSGFLEVDPSFSWGYCSFSIFEGDNVDEVNLLYGEKINEHVPGNIGLDYQGILAPGEYRIVANAVSKNDVVSVDFAANFAAIPEPTSGALILVAVGIFGLRNARIRRDADQPYIRHRNQS
jgi:hypothetical protein